MQKKCSKGRIFKSYRLAETVTIHITSVFKTNRYNLLFFLNTTLWTVRTFYVFKCCQNQCKFFVESTGHRMFVLTFLLGKPEPKFCITWQSLSISEKSNNNLPLYLLLLREAAKKGPLENWAKAARTKQRWRSFPASSHTLLGSSLVLWAFFFISIAKNISFTKTFREKELHQKILPQTQVPWSCHWKKVEQTLFHILKLLCKK